MNNMLTVTEEQLNLFLSLFRGRQDFYARHWEKNGKSGYSPAYDFDWTEFMEFKNRGGKLKDFPKSPSTNPIFGLTLFFSAANLL